MDASFELVGRAMYGIAETGLNTSELPFTNAIASHGDREHPMERCSIHRRCEDDQCVEIGILAVSWM